MKLLFFLILMGVLTFSSQAHDNYFEGLGMGMEYALERNPSLYNATAHIFKSANQNESLRGLNEGWEMVVDVMKSKGEEKWIKYSNLEYTIDQAFFNNLPLGDKLYELMTTKNMGNL